MSIPKHVGVIDIGKTNVKVAVVDIESGTEIGVLTRPNRVLAGPPYPHYDIDGHWTFICDSLRDLHLEHGINAVTVTTHGASLVLLDDSGGLAAPVLDYEFDGPDTLKDAYDAVRPAFNETGSPRLPMGLNAGAQLFWQLSADPGLRSRLATVLTYPQYWTYRLTGICTNEVTSLGCHTDLWNPLENGFSSLVDRLGLADRMAPVKRAADHLGGLLPDIARQTGLPAQTPVSCGVHDSNASLYPHLIGRTGAFSVVSTGTWVIALAIGGSNTVLDPSRDTLINVNAFGDPVPSARFMGGREFDTILEGRGKDYASADVDRVLEQSIQLLPAVDPRSGPFQGRQHSWTTPVSSLSDGECLVALSFYLALVTSECLGMIGADGPVVVEGPFARNPLYLAMLAAATGRNVEAAGASLTGTSIGAALLAAGTGSLCSAKDVALAAPRDPDPRLRHYAETWQKTIRGPV